jgi:hypothetical protein
MGTDDPVREIENLKALVAWYRSWAELAGNADERDNRLRIAALVEARIAIVVAANLPDD